MQNNTHSSFPVGSIGNAETLETWLNNATEETATDQADQIYAYYHPRVQFIKSLPRNSKLIDAGAGDGGLISFRTWLLPDRNDLVFFGTSLTHAGVTNKYDEFKEAYITATSPKFSERANALIACHLIEHLESPRLLFEWADSVLSSHSKLFLEWPAPHTIYLPKAQEVIMPANMIAPQTLNFYDDKSHISPILPDHVISSAIPYGFELTARGFVTNDYAADLLRNCAVNCPNPFYSTVAIWLKTYFSTYMVFSR